MFDYVSDKIKGVVSILTVIYVIGLIAGIINVFKEETRTIGIICIVAVVFGYVNLLILYGFAELLENIATIKDKVVEMKSQQSIIKPVDNHKKDFTSVVTHATQSSAQKGAWRCVCGRENPDYVGTCACGRKKAEQ